MAPGTLSSRISFRAGLVLLALYVVAGAVYSALLPTAARFQDEAEYWALAGHLVHGPGFSLDGRRLTAVRPPGYPFLLAAIRAAGGGVVAARIVQFGLIGATILLAARLAGKKREALLPAVILAGLYPVIFYTGGTLYAQTFAGFLFMAALAQWLAAGKRAGRAFAGGLAFGLLILAVPTFALTLPVVLVAGGFLGVMAWRALPPALLGAALIVGAWTARNGMEFHRFVPVASNSGVNFLAGNNGNAVPYGGVDNVDLGRYVGEARARGLGEFESDRFYRAAALRWIAHHPGRAARLYVEKVLNFFNVWNEYAPGNRSEISTGKQVVMAASYLLLLGLTAWRLAEAGRFPLEAREIFLLLVYVASAFTMAVFMTRIRFRIPYDFLLIAVVAGHLARRWPAGGGRS